MYSNSLLATLNARNRLRDRSANDVSVSLRDLQAPGNITRLSVSGTLLMSTSDHDNYGSALQQRGERIAIRIETTKETDTAVEVCTVDTEHDENSATQSPTSLWADAKNSQCDSEGKEHEVEEV